MSDILSIILPDGLPPFVSFPPTSRYASTPLLVAEVDGEEIRYLDCRLLPLVETLTVISEHVVVEGERPDTVAATYLGDAEQWWRICDANLLLRPEELTETIGRRIRITMPPGFPAGPNA